MKAVDLLKPRFEVIADYPNLKYNVGRILSPIKEGSSYYDCINAPSTEIVGFPEKYPHLFKPLNWWEKRKIEDMPKKLISLSFPEDEPYTIIEWDMKYMIGYVNIKTREVCDLTAMAIGYGYNPVD